MPAEAGIQNYLKTLDSRLRGNDVKGRFKTFYETIKQQIHKRTKSYKYLIFVSPTRSKPERSRDCTTSGTGDPIAEFGIHVV